MRIAIIGARSVPGRYGGFDTVATELAPRLVERGLDLTVYCQPRYAAPDRPRRYRGVELVYVPSAPRRSMEAVSHEALSLAQALSRGYDAIYVLGTRASAIYAPAIALGVPVFFNTDGHDWQRRKWGPRARRYLRWSEAVAVRLAPNRLIADSRAIAGYFVSAYGVEPSYITYGANIVVDADAGLLMPYGLEPRAYHLVVCRIEPENNVDAIVAAYRLHQTKLPLVIVGGTNFDSPYFDRLKASAPREVRFLGGIYDPDQLNALYFYSYTYIHGHEVGGTNPALLHAMGAGCCILANDVVFNREVIDGAGLLWRPTSESLRAVLSEAEQDPDRARRLGAAAQQRARVAYDWEEVADRYADRFKTGIAAGRRRARS